MIYRVRASFIESVGKMKIKPHKIDRLEETPLLAVMTLERFLDEFNEKCYDFHASIIMVRK